MGKPRLHGTIAPPNRCQQTVYEWQSVFTAAISGRGDFRLGLRHSAEVLPPFLLARPTVGNVVSIAIEK